MTTTISHDLERIKKLYKKIPSKSEFFLAAEKEFNIKAISIKANWFNGVWGVPHNKIKQLLVFMEEYISNLAQQATIKPQNNHQQVLWYLINWKEFSLADVINDSMFYKFQTRLSEIEREHGVISTKTNQNYTNKFGQKTHYTIYKCIDKKKTRELILKYQ